MPAGVDDDQTDTIITDNSRHPTKSQIVGVRYLKTPRFNNCHSVNGKAHKPHFCLCFYLKSNINYLFFRERSQTMKIHSLQQWGAMKTEWIAVNQSKSLFSFTYIDAVYLVSLERQILRSDLHPQNQTLNLNNYCFQMDRERNRWKAPGIGQSDACGFPSGQCQYSRLFWDPAEIYRAWLGCSATPALGSCPHSIELTFISILIPYKIILRE